MWGMISVVFSPCHPASIPLIVAHIWVAVGMLGVEKFTMSGNLLYKLNLRGMFGALVLGLAYGILAISKIFKFGRQADVFLHCAVRGWQDLYVLIKTYPIYHGHIFFDAQIRFRYISPSRKRILTTSPPSAEVVPHSLPLKTPAPRKECYEKSPHSTVS